MTEFRTVLPPRPAPLGVSYRDAVLSLGSCFAEHIGRRLGRSKFRVHLNPFGILYNPVSVAAALDELLSEAPFPGDALFEHGGLWHSFAHHGRFSHPDRTTALAGIRSALAAGRAFLSQTTRLMLTFGTAHVFTERASGRVAANCHKLPAERFERRRLDVGEVTSALMPVLRRLRERLPALEVIATVSPVRHLRDGLIENQRSKATLVLAVDQLVRELPFVHYFPAYELLLDDLRDYRFFESDLVHPNTLAVDYVWDYFRTALFDEDTRQVQEQVERILRAAAHRPFHPHTPEHQTFLHRQLALIAGLETRYPFLDWAAEKEQFRAQLV